MSRRHKIVAPWETAVQSDVLSDVLRAVRLTGAVYFDFELSSPWVAEAPPASELRPKVMPGAQRVIEYHVIARGAAWSNAIGQAPVRLEEGDFVVFPQGDGHVLSSEPGMRTTPMSAPVIHPSTSLPIAYEIGGGGPDRDRIVCGFLGFDDRPFNPLIAALPAMIHVPAAGPGADTSSLKSLLEIAIRESVGTRAGSSNVLARVSELLFVEVVRRHIETLPAAETGWLAGLRDPIIGQALSALHSQPTEPWTVERLARLVGVSRSVFAERFAEMVGHPPMQYLALWRMQLASRLLMDGGHVAEVAGDVGYESEAAFSRAFKKLVGEAPATWRKRATHEAVTDR